MVIVKISGEEKAVHSKELWSRATHKNYVGLSRT